MVVVLVVEVVLLVRLLPVAVLWSLMGDIHVELTPSMSVWCVGNKTDTNPPTENQRRIFNAERDIIAA